MKGGRATAMKGATANIHIVVLRPKASARYPEKALPNPPVPKPNPRIRPEAKPRWRGMSSWARTMVTEKDARSAAPDAAAKSQSQAPSPYEPVRCGRLHRQKESGTYSYSHERSLKDIEHKKTINEAQPDETDPSKGDTNKHEFPGPESVDKRPYG